MILMKCIYKTNRFNMPLLNIIRTSGMNTTLHLAQYYLCGETQADYAWALQFLRRLLQQNEILDPQVAFVYRDEALLNALKTRSRESLCFSSYGMYSRTCKHIQERIDSTVLNESVSTRTTRKYVDSEERTAFCGVFIDLIRSNTEE